MHTLWPPFLASVAIAFVLTVTGPYWYPYVAGDPDEQLAEGGAHLGPEHNGWERRTSKPKEEYLDWLMPVMRADYIACEIDGKSRARRARERGVAPATVSDNIGRAHERLEDIYEEREGLA